MDLVVDGAVLLVEPVSPAAVDAACWDGVASALGKGSFNGVGDTLLVLLDAVLEHGGGIAEDALDEHVDAAFQLGDAVGWRLVSPVLPNL